jgi:mxaJ protein
MAANRGLSTGAGRRILAFAASALGSMTMLACPAAATDNASAADQAKAAFRVCADPNNLPFSNEAQAGFENKLADLIAAEFHEPVAYVWHAQRRGFIRETLKARKCDVVMGVPAQYDLVEATRPYYRSSYVFVSRADRHIDIQSITDPRLRDLKVGVQLIGDDGFNTPPAHALASQGIVNNIVGFPVYGDYRQPNPPAEIVKAVERGDIDVAAVWGPLAGYFAQRSNVPLTVKTMTDTESFSPLIFKYSIAMGVRKGDDALRAKLDAVIAEKRPEIEALLKSYGIPLVAMPEQASLATDQPKQ